MSRFWGPDEPKEGYCAVCGFRCSLIELDVYDRCPGCAEDANAREAAVVALADELGIGGPNGEES